MAACTCGGAGARRARRAFRDAELVDVGQQLRAQAGPLGNEPGAADDRVARRPAAVLGRVVLVVRGARPSRSARR